MSEAALFEPATASAHHALTDLILLRLLPEAKSVPPKKLRADLRAFFPSPPSGEQVAGGVAALRAEGFVEQKSQRATGAGRARALRLLGVERLPPRASWKTLKAKFLVPMALGISADSAEYAKADSGERLAAFLLKRELGLAAGVRATLPAVLDAVLCRQLGFPQFTSVGELLRTKLGEAIGGDPITRGEAVKVFPRVRLNVTRVGKDELYAAILRGALAAPHPQPEPEPKPELNEIENPFDLEAFANTVRAAARACPTGRFGGHKVFISHVWRQLRDEPRFAPLGLAGFKQKLVEANRADLLTLGRADLVQLMDPADVRESETSFLTATFHFILVEGN